MKATATIGVVVSYLALVSQTIDFVINKFLVLFALYNASLMSYFVFYFLPIA
jgi:hypothetical protein